MAETSGRGAHWRHFDVSVMLDGTGATCDQATGTIAGWLRTDDPHQGEWFCQSSHGTPESTLIGGCRHFPTGNPDADADAAATADGTFEVAVATRCGSIHQEGVVPQAVRAFSVKCRTARALAKRVAKGRPFGGCLVAGRTHVRLSRRLVRRTHVRLTDPCTDSGYRCSAVSAAAGALRVRCLRGERREVAFRL